MAYRVVAKFDDQTIRSTLQTGRNLLGSDPSCEVCLPNPTVSRRHAVLTVGDGVELEDLGSTNGTLLRSKRIDREHVQPGDIFVIGRVVVLVEEIPDDDLEVGIGVPRIGVDPSGKIRLDFDEIRETTDSFTPLDRFALEHLPRLLEHLYRNPTDHQDLAQKLGYALFETMPVATVEISELNAGEKGVLYTADRSTDESLLPQWIESSNGPVQVRACYDTRSAGDHYRPIIESAALLLAVATRRRALDPEAEPVRFVPPARPLPLTVDAKVRQVYDQAERVSRGDVGVMIYGESGTGKEVLANFIHQASPRTGKNLVAINCASLPRDLLEAELFGVERGVATGVEARPGKFEAADGGTLFLDEVGDMAPETQAKILRVLQEKEVYRIGGNTPRPARARIIAATNRPLQKMITEGTFRNDLFHRIATWEVELPPLRHRRADIPNLAVFFLTREAQRHKVRTRGISRAALRALKRYRWPGNIRQLRNEVARSVLFLENKELLDTSRLSPPIRGAAEETASSLAGYLESVERDEIMAALEVAGGHTQAAADVLKMSRATLYRKLKSMGVDTKNLK